MALYMHWLDGEYIKITRRMKGLDSLAQASPLHRMLKLHALFGTEIILSDVQIIDSKLVLELFADSEFRSFLEDQDKVNDSFMRLVADAEDEEPRRFSIATSGIRRSLAPRWVSSTFDDRRAVIDLGQAILKAQKLDPIAQLGEDAPGTIGHTIKLKWPKYGKLLEGMLWAVHHFAESSNAPVDSAGKRTQSFYDELVSLAQSPAFEKEGYEKYREYIKTTLAHISEHVEDKAARHRRSIILDTLNTETWPEKDQIVWHTIVNAWNCAVQKTVKADGGSIGDLPYSAPIGIFQKHEKPRDALVPVRIVGNRVDVPSSGKMSLSFLSWDPATLSWNEIKNARNNTIKTRRAFQEAYRANSEDRDYYRNIFSAIEDHADKLAQCFGKRALPDIPNYFWVIGARVAVYVGRPDLATNIELMGGMYKGLDDALRRGYGFRVANTLRESGYSLISDQKE